MSFWMFALIAVSVLLVCTLVRLGAQRWPSEWLKRRRARLVRFEENRAIVGPLAPSLNEVVAALRQQVAGSNSLGRAEMTQLRKAIEDRYTDLSKRVSELSAGIGEQHLAVDTVKLVAHLRELAGFLVNPHLLSSIQPTEKSAAIHNLYLESVAHLLSSTEVTSKVAITMEEDLFSSLLYPLLLCMRLSPLRSRASRIFRQVYQELEAQDVRRREAELYREILDIALSGADIQRGIESECFADVRVKLMHLVEDSP